MPLTHGSKTHLESDTSLQLRDAVSALRRVENMAIEAGYGSQVLGPLGDAINNAQYALDTIEGRN